VSLGFACWFAAQFCFFQSFCHKPRVSPFLGLVFAISRFENWVWKEKKEMKQGWFVEIRVERVAVYISSDIRGHFLLSRG
jgi:hypothetical protein